MNTVTKTSSKDDSLKLYYDHVKQIPLLSMEEEQALSKRIMAGDESARSKMIESNLRLVIKIARAYSNFDISLMDLIQEGNIGLIKAAEKFDYHKEVRFSTYASWWIKQSITRALVNTRRTIRLPHRKEELIRKISKATAYLSQTLCREPTVDEIATELNVARKQIVEAMEKSGAVIPLEGMQEDDEVGTVLDVFADETYSPDTDIMKQEMKENVISLLEALMEKEKQVLLYRFEFFGAKNKTLKGIGNTLGVSAENVRQIEKRAIRKLRVTADAEDFMYY